VREPRKIASHSRTRQSVDTKLVIAIEIVMVPLKEPAGTHCDRMLSVN
jgi:hypothetical protein